MLLNFTCFIEQQQQQQHRRTAKTLTLINTNTDTNAPFPGKNEVSIMNIIQNIFVT